MKYGTILELKSRKNYRMGNHISLGEKFEVVNPKDIPEHILSTLCPLMKDEFYIKRLTTGNFYLYHKDNNKNNFKKIKKG